MNEEPDVPAGDRGQRDPVRAMADLQRAGLGSLSWMGTAWLEAMGDIGAEVASFVATRIREDAATQHAILHCHDPEELQRIQGHFMQRAIDQYVEETGRMVELGSHLWDEARADSTAAGRPKP